jgi:MFS family permease
MPEDQPTSKSGLRGLHRNIWVLTVTSFLTDISSEMIINLIPLFLTSVLQAGTAVVGLIEGLAETTASLMKVFSGALSDKLGKRKGLAVLGYGLSALSKPFLYFAQFIGWGGILGVRIADRLGKGIRTSPRDAMLAGSVDQNNRGLGFGVQRAGDTAGAFIGLAIAALIIWLTQTNPEVLSADTFQVAVLVSIIPAGLAVLVLGLVGQEVAPKRKQSGALLSFKGLDKRFILYLVASIIFSLGNSSDAFIILLAKERGLSFLQVMFMLMTFNAVYALLSGPAGSLSDRIGRRKLILFGWLAYGLIYLGFGFSRSGVGVWVLFGLYGVYYALTAGAGKAIIADLVPDEKRGTAYGLYHAALGIAAFPASAIAGLLWQGIGGWKGFGPSAPFFFGAGLALVAGLLFATWLREPKKL